jgi:hypothetical protein
MAPVLASVATQPSTCSDAKASQLTQESLITHSSPRFAVPSPSKASARCADSSFVYCSPYNRFDCNHTRNEYHDAKESLDLLQISDRDKTAFTPPRIVFTSPPCKSARQSKLPTVTACLLHNHHDVPSFDAKVRRVLACQKRKGRKARTHLRCVVV